MKIEKKVHTVPNRPALIIEQHILAIFSYSITRYFQMFKFKSTITAK
jgi:hypothetical protein